MIARVWHGRTDVARADEYTKYLQQTGVTDLRRIPGNRGVLVLCDRGGSEAKFTLISFWDSVDAIRKFAGEDVLKARYYPQDRDFLRELEPHVQHLDVAVTEGPLFSGERASRPQ